MNALFEWIHATIANDSMELVHFLHHLLILIFEIAHKWVKKSQSARINVSELRILINLYSVLRDSIVIVHLFLNVYNSR